MSGGHIALRLWDGLKDLEVEAKLLVHTEDGGNVATAVAVVRGGPDGDQVLVREHELVALLNQLVSAAYQGKIVNVGELGVDQRRGFVSRHSSKNWTEKKGSPPMSPCFRRAIPHHEGSQPRFQCPLGQTTSDLVVEGPRKKVNWGLNGCEKKKKEKKKKKKKKKYHRRTPHGEFPGNAGWS